VRDRSAKLGTPSATIEPMGPRLDRKIFDLNQLPVNTLGVTHALGFAVGWKGGVAEQQRMARKLLIASWTAGVHDQRKAISANHPAFRAANAGRD
jgi:hypothetical protein